MNAPRKPPESKFHCACGRPELGLDAMTPETRMQRMGYRTPADTVEPDQHVPYGTRS
jgi:hypothetical protein